MNTPFLDEKYLIREQLAQGRFSTVYRILDNYGSQYALKSIDKSRFENVHYDLIRNEAKIHEKLKHINIIKLFEFLEKPEYMFFITEYADKGELFEQMEDGGLSDEISYLYFSQLINALYYMYSKHNIYHGDIKLENVLLTSNDIIKLCDFGYSKYEEEITGIFGTPEYMAPEMLHGKVISHKIDIWACGVMLYEMITGTPLFDDENPVIVFKMIAESKNSIEFPDTVEIRNNIKDLILKLLNHDPEKRLTYKQIYEHPWLNGRSNHPMFRKTISMPSIKLPKLDMIKVQEFQENLSPLVSGRTKENEEKKLSKTNSERKDDETPRETSIKETEKPTETTEIIEKINITKEKDEKTEKINSPKSEVDEETITESESENLNSPKLQKLNIPKYHLALEEAIYKNDIINDPEINTYLEELEMEQQQRIRSRSVGSSLSGSRIGRKSIRRKSNHRSSSSSPNGSRNANSLRARSYENSHKGSRIGSLRSSGRSRSNSPRSRPSTPRKSSVNNSNSTIILTSPRGALRTRSNDFKPSTRKHVKRRKRRNYDSDELEKLIFEFRKERSYGTIRSLRGLFNRYKYKERNKRHNRSTRSKKSSSARY